MDKSILLKNELALPIEYKDCTCEAAIVNKLEKYISVLSDFSAPEEIRDKVVVFQSDVKGIFKEYYLGHHNKAFNAFARAINKLTDNNLFKTELPKIPFYRARKNEDNEDFDDYGMFHMPFELRGQVSTQRFSFPGLPCLYLGASTYVCWVELNRPTFDQFQVAMIRQKPSGEQYNLINLSIHPVKLHEKLSKNETSISLEQYLIWWPIIAVCSVAVKNEKDIFKPEYVFPQFMLQYLLEKMTPEDAIGIKYLSIKAGKITKKQYESDERVYSNYIIPIRNTADKGFCSFLQEEFKVIRNYSGKELMILTDTMRMKGTKAATWGDLAGEKTLTLSPETILGRNNKPVSYSESMLARIEKILNSEDVDRFDDDTGEMDIKPITDEEIDYFFRVEDENIIIEKKRKPRKRLK